MQQRRSGSASRREHLTRPTNSEKIERLESQTQHLAGKVERLFESNARLSQRVIEMDRRLRVLMQFVWQRHRESE